MGAMVFHGYGEPDVISLGDVSVLEPQHREVLGDVLIRVCYAGFSSGCARSSEVLRLEEARKSYSKSVAAGINLVRAARREELLAEVGRSLETGV